MRNSIQFFSLMLMIWGYAVFVRFAQIKPVFEENPLLALGFALVASLVYRCMMEDNNGR